MARIVRFEDYQVDLQTCELRKNGKKIRLSGQPFQILALLLEKSGELVTREELRAKLWADEVFVDFDHSLNTAINKLREALRDSTSDARFIETLPKRGYRFIGPIETQDVPAARQTAAISTTSTPEGAVHELAQGAIKRRWSSIVGGTVVIVAIVVGTFFYFHHRPKLTEKDSVVLADFVNSTGDPVFDGSLREALAAKLDESPYFNIVSDAAIQQALRLMKQSPDTPLTPELAREVCQRGVSGAVLAGTISGIGNKYALTLNAINCESGASLARIEAEADGKDNVLPALGKLASSMRGRLGESLASVEKFNRPSEQLTTSSLEALKAYSLGRSAFSKLDNSSSVPFFQRATMLDPNFAMAYAVLGAAYGNLGEGALSRENATKAFALHDRVSEREKLYIDTHYCDSATRDLNKAAEVYQLWEQIYPRDFNPWNNLGVLYRDLGQPEKAEQQFLGVLRIRSDNVIALSNLGLIFRMENRFEESKSILQKEVNQVPNSSSLHADLGVTAFAKNDRAGMQRQIEWLNANGHEDEALQLEASSEAFLGKLRESRVLVDHFISIAQQKRFNGSAASAAAEEANAEALFGNLQQGRTYADRAISFQPDDAEPGAVQALALSGQSARAEKLLDQVVKKHPDDTLLNGIEVPVARAILAMARNKASQALTILEPVQQYRLAPESIYLYVRGLAYLQVKQGKEATVEFLTILDHRGLFSVSPTYPLAHLGLARAYMLEGETVKARARYQDFLTLWKDADPDVPILIAAKAEYAKLK